MIRGIYAIVILDLKRAWLDRARLVAGLAQPLLYLFVLGAGLGASSQQGAVEYKKYIFPGGAWFIAFIFSGLCGYRNCIRQANRVF